MNLQQIIETEKTLPKVIFLDAMGTLFGLKSSVGEVYGKLAEQYGVKTDYQGLNQAFLRSFKETTSLAFPMSPASEIPSLEKQWWLKIAQQTFMKTDVLQQFANFSDFFNTLYDHFATVQPWFIYSDVIPALTFWQRQGIRLGVISNFDSRLMTVLQGLKIAHFFESITLSSYAGVAKPNPQIFQLALAKHHCLPSQAWHIGDSQTDDYEGATRSGIKAFWVNSDRR